MNILASYDWLKQYVDLSGSIDTFAEKLSVAGPSVEHVFPQGELLKGIYAGKILRIEKHPDPQVTKLQVAYVDLGAVQKEPLKIVCGGSNIAEGQWVAVATIGSFVRWHGEGEPVELTPAEIRGVPSEGMICGANEIGLFDAFPHAEREILDLGKELGDGAVGKFRAGAPLADVLGLAGDHVMDIEVTTNRPDLMGMLGLAREASAILKKPLTWKPSQLPKPASGKKNEEKTAAVSVHVREKKLCPRYMAARIDGVTVKPSPWWLKRRLISAGLRPINNLVDITNFVLLELGQPMHVFDAEKLEGQKIIVRRAVAGETIQALDGKNYPLDENMVVIADAVKPVAIAGVMGGDGSAVGSGTRSIVFEAATFDALSVRRTSRKLNLFSDSQLRFEKGLSSEAPTSALARAVELCLELAGGTLIAAPTDVVQERYKPLRYSVTIEQASQLIGVTIPAKEMADTLKRLGFIVKADAKKLTADVPWWRDHDIEDGRDLVEEIARIYGYHRIPAIFPSHITNRAPDAGLIWEQRMRQFAKSAGLTGIYTYSFVSRSLLEKTGYDPAHMLRIQNPLSEDFEFMRSSLLPSMIQTVVENQERDRFQSLFELAHIYPRKIGETADGVWRDLPDEQSEFVAAFLRPGVSWKEAKGFADGFLKELGITGVAWKRVTDDDFWHPGRTVHAFVGPSLVATIGELHPRLAEAFKIEGRLSLVSMDVPELLMHATTAKHYVPAPLFPEAKRDVALIVDRKVEVADLLSRMRATTDVLREAEWFDTYEGKGVAEGKKSVAFHLTFGRSDRTLETAEVDAAMKTIQEQLASVFGAEVRA